MGIDILIADLRTLFRKGFCATFASNPSVTSITEVTSHTGLKEQLVAHCFDLIV
ncbi:MAG: hypothetical protein ABI324_20155 [Ktedonobacteraceae bacterium]